MFGSISLPVMIDCLRVRLAQNKSLLSGDFVIKVFNYLI